MSVVRFGSDAPWEAVVGYSRVVVHGDMAWVSGTTATVDGAVVHPGDAGAQTRQVLATIEESLERAGFTLADVVRTRMYVTDITKDGTLRGPNLDLLREVCAATPRPVVASGGVSSLDDIRALAALTLVGVEGAIVGKALYAGAFTLPEALRVTEGAAS